jgi:hypothetical protein
MRERGSIPHTMRITLCLSLFLILSPAIALATDSSKGWGNMSGNDLLPDCSVAVSFADNGKNLPLEQMVSMGRCMYYISGFLDGHSLASAVGSGSPSLCFPKGGSLGQMVRVVTKWMRDHPEKLNESAAMCVYRALVDAFPCRSPR